MRYKAQNPCFERSVIPSEDGGYRIIKMFVAFFALVTLLCGLDVIEATTNDSFG